MHDISPPDSRRRRQSGLRIAVPLLSLALLMAGCASYRPLPLEHKRTSLTDLSALKLDANSLKHAGLPPHRFDPSDGLDMTEIAMLAVANNPDLKLARDAAGIAYAQAFAAGLLPDPQINLSGDFPGAAGLIPAFNRGLSFDVSSLLTLSAHRSAGRAERKKADLSLLWQEWQVINQTRQQFIRVVFLDRSVKLLQQALSAAQARYAASAEALAAGNTTLDGVAPLLTAQEDARRQLSDQTRQLVQARHNLNTILGLSPDVKLDLVQPPAYAPLDEAAIRHELRDLPRRRPDLLALAAGYHAQEARLRAAVLAQFPSLNIGFTRARDTSGVYSSGFTVAVNLPIFNRNRGNIAIAKATRQRLHDEYENRVNAAYADVEKMLDDQRILAQQIEAARPALRTLENTVKAATIAYRDHNMTLNNYVNLQSGLLAKQSELLSLEQTALEQRIALQGLLGGDLPGKTVNSMESK